MDKLLKHEGLGESMYVRTLPTGLTCYIIPKKGFSEKHAMLCVNFGSADIEFQVNNESVITPEGIAHFLEHKAFEDDKIDYFDEFTKLSGNVNAYTNFNSTVYYFSCHENFKDCLELLFDMTLNLYITDETVEKEKGIIEQEISMYDDDPNWRVYFNMLQGLYKKNPVKNEIAGTADSIAKIDRRMLRKCFDTFYVPANMALVCAGDFDMDEIFRISESKTSGITSPAVSKIYPVEPAASVKNHVYDHMQVSKPLFSYGFKNEIGESKVKDVVSTKILLDMISGGSSETYNRLYQEGLLDSGYGMDYSNGSGYAITMFTGASKDIDRVHEAITGSIAAMKEKGVDSDVFQRIQKKHLGRYLRSFNSVASIAGMQADFYTKGFHIFDIAEAMEHVTAEDINRRVNECFKADNACLSVVNKA